MSNYRGKNFTPFNNYTVAFANTAASQNTVVVQPTNISGGGISAQDLLISNSTSSVAFIAWGLTTQTALVASSFPVLPGETMIIDMGQAATNVAVVLSAAATGSVYLSIGAGA